MTRSLLRSLQHRFSALCFDLDGTLIDPYPGIARSIAFALDRLGRTDIDVTDYKPFIGPPIQETFRSLLGNDERLVARGVQYFRERYADSGLLDATPYQNIPGVLAELCTLVPLFVCTSKPTIYAEHILSAFGLDSYFAGVYGSELDGSHTNKSELLAWLIEREAPSPAGTAMVGDRALDLRAAKENGVPAFGVLWGYGSEAELVAAEATELFTEVEELRRLISPTARVER